jgi:glycosyltransferase involved in cell wall biosynthesis
MKSYGKNMIRALAKSQSQIFHVHAPTYRVDPLFLIAAVIARLKRRRFVISILGGAFLQLMQRPLYRRIIRLAALNLADGIISVDPAVYKKLFELLPKRKRKMIHYFSPPVDTDLFKAGISGSEVKAKYGVKSNQQLVLFGPHLDPVYAPDQFIEAAALVVKKHPNFMFMLVGEGTKEHELKSLVTKLTLEKNVIFVGPVPHEQMPKYYAACEINCNPCVLGQGYSALEALACEKPVIGARAKMQIRIEDKVDGLLFEPGNIEDFASKISWLLEHPEKRREMGVRGRNRVVEQHSLKTQTQKHIEIYNEITLHLNNPFT